MSQLYITTGVLYTPHDSYSIFGVLNGFDTPTLDKNKPYTLLIDAQSEPLSTCTNRAYTVDAIIAVLAQYCRIRSVQLQTRWGAKFSGLSPDEHGMTWRWIRVQTVILCLGLMLASTGLFWYYRHMAYTRMATATAALPVGHQNPAHAILQALEPYELEITYFNAENGDFTLVGFETEPMTPAGRDSLARLPQVDTLNRVRKNDTVWIRITGTL